jgi:hypothetical protein
MAVELKNRFRCDLGVVIAQIVRLLQATVRELAEMWSREVPRIGPMAP